MSNFKSQAKRKRELAKLSVRQAKEQKRAQRKAAATAAAVETAASSTSALASDRASLETQAGRPSTFAEAVERWKRTKVVPPKRR